MIGSARNWKRSTTNLTPHPRWVCWVSLAASELWHCCVMSAGLHQGNHQRTGSHLPQDWRWQNAGIVKWDPFGGNETLQMYGQFEGFSLKIWCIVWVVFFHDPWNVHQPPDFIFFSHDFDPQKGIFSIHLNCTSHIEIGHRVLKKTRLRSANVWEPNQRPLLRIWRTKTVRHRKALAALKTRRPTKLCRKLLYAPWN